NNAHLGLSGGNLRRRKIAWSNVVIIPEAEMNRLATRKELPHLRREDTKVRTRIRGGLRSRMPRENMQHPHTEPTVLILLTPDARWQVHEGGKGTIGTA